jgi:hypothetical protein
MIRFLFNLSKCKFLQKLIQIRLRNKPNLMLNVKFKQINLPNNAKGNLV